MPAARPGAVPAEEAASSRPDPPGVADAEPGVAPIASAPVMASTALVESRCLRDTVSPVWLKRVKTRFINAQDVRKVTS
ncbi:hypothetical protein Cco03nite_39700 [Catellatospora coxensis]|uniref:Uncharacterized protein n=1 Tax=Catellatospora coxensis TaxID=310354 RepID=A0A8J3L3U7_9ACTN|nr:hypothetical protein Cco03nite_39700 [Catellatospora coxensis]